MMPVEISMLSFRYCVDKQISSSLQSQFDLLVVVFILFLHCAHCESAKQVWESLTNEKKKLGGICSCCRIVKRMIWNWNPHTWPKIKILIYTLSISTIRNVALSKFKLLLQKSICENCTRKTERTSRGKQKNLLAMRFLTSINGENSDKTAPPHFNSFKS